LFRFYEELVDGTSIACAKAWLSEVVRNAAISMCRKAGRKCVQAMPDDSAQAIEDRRQADPSKAVSDAEQIAEAVKAVSDLPPAQATIVKLRLDNWKLKDIAAELKMPISTVHFRWQEAMQRLRRDLDTVNA